MDSVNSTTFIKRPPCMTDTQEKFLYTKELLSGRIFLGCYQERRYVSALNEYRDVVIIHSEETELQTDLDKLQKKWMDFKNIKWVGITGPDTVDLPNAYCFWVKLTNLAFGYYWFQIKHVQLKEAEILMHLKCIRKSQAVQPVFTTSTFEKVRDQNKNEESEPTTSLGSSFGNFKWDLANDKITAAMKTCNDGIHIILPHLTWTNIFRILRVACGLTIAILMGTVTFIGHLGEYILRLIREISLLVHAFSPIIIHLIDFFTKIIGGFFILIAGLCGRNVSRTMTHLAEKNIVRNANSFQNPPIHWRERNRMLRKELLSSDFKKRSSTEPGTADLVSPATSSGNCGRQLGVCWNCQSAVWGFRRLPECSRLFWNILGGAF